MYNCICFNLEIHTLVSEHRGLSPYLKHFWSSCMFVSQKKKKMQTFHLYWMLLVDIKIIHFHDSAENGKRGFEWYFEKLRFQNLVLNFWKNKFRPQWSIIVLHLSHLAWFQSKQYYFIIFHLAWFWSNSYQHRMLFPSKSKEYCFTKFSISFLQIFSMRLNDN